MRIFCFKDDTEIVLVDLKRVFSCRPIVVTIFSGSQFLNNREVVNEREGTCPKSLVPWLAHIHNYA